MPKRVMKLVLPFAVPTRDRVKDFTKNMEMAAIFYLAEGERGKGEGRILKKPAEKLVFITEAGYPIWLVPWRGRILLFDGLGGTAYTFSYDKLPDIEVFDNDVQGSTKKTEAYLVALSQNASYFQNFAGKEEKTIEGLITDPDFTQDFVSYLSEVTEIEKPVTAKTILSPTLDESEISAAVEELSEFRNKLKRDIRDVDKSMKLLSMRTREQTKVIHREIKKIRREFSRRIEKAKPTVVERMRLIQEKFDEEITRISKKFEMQLQSIHKNRIKFEKIRERLTLEISRCEAEIKSCRLNNNEGSEIQWSQKLEETKKRLPALEKNIKDLEKKIENVETAKNLKISRRKAKLDTRIEKARKVLRDLEAAQEAMIEMKQKEIASLKEATSLIINQMNAMVKAKKAALDKLDRLGTSKRIRKYAWVDLPLYFTCYEAELKKRYVVYPPSIIGSMGKWTQLKGIFGATKMKSFLQPRSKAIAALLNQLVVLTEDNPVFEKELSVTGMKTNILRTRELRMGVKRGLEELREEKWISEGEFEVFSKKL